MIRKEEIAGEMSEVLGEIEEELEKIWGILPLLLKGNPVSPAQVAEQFQITELEAVSVLDNLRSYGAEFNEQDEFVGFGLTLNPTPHKYEVEEHTFYAYCGPDTLFFPIFFNHTATITSSDPVTGNKIRLTVNEKGIKNIDPDSAMVSFKPKNILVENIRGTCCSYQHFFESADTASEYTSLHKSAGIEILTPEEAYKVCKIISEENIFPFKGA
jgi:alkylmercury lyase